MEVIVGSARKRRHLPLSDDEARPHRHFLVHMPPALRRILLRPRTVLLLAHPALNILLLAHIHFQWAAFVVKVRAAASLISVRSPSVPAFDSCRS